jgi:hypothetical protein
MINPFERFYDVEADVGEKSENTYASCGEITTVGTVLCDVQPYSDNTESENHGLCERKSYKIFCDKNDLIKTGRYIAFGGAWYMIVSVSVWSFGMTAVIRDVVS